MTKEIQDLILNADGKALGTYGPEGLNVVPVSSVKIREDKIILVNYFFGKTLENIKENKEVSLSAWKGLEGFQIKAEAEYQEEGDLFQEITAWIKDTLPDRIVKGVLILSPKEIFDVSAGSNAGTKIS